MTETETTEDFTLPETLVERIAAIQAQLTTFGRDLTISAGRSSEYSATSYGAIAKVLRPLMAKYRINCCLSVIKSKVVQTEMEWGSNKVLLYKARYLASFATEKSGELIVFNVEAHALDTGDKAPGKAQTYALKSALKQLFLIDTGDAEEARVEDEVRARRESLEAGKLSPVKARKYIDGLLKCVEDSDGPGLLELGDELTGDQKQWVWAQLRSWERAALNKLGEEAEKAANQPDPAWQDGGET